MPLLVPLIGLHFLVAFESPAFFEMFILSLPILLFPLLIFHQFNRVFKSNPLVKTIYQRFGQVPPHLGKMLDLYVKTLTRRCYVTPDLREDVFCALDVAATYGKARDEEIAPVIARLRATLKG